MSGTRLSDFTFIFHFHALEKEMATHSSVLAWRIPVTGEPGGLPSMGLHRVRHDWSNLAAAAANPSVSYLPIQISSNFLFFLIWLFHFLFFSFIFISWRLITLQYCSVFCHTLTWISHGFTCIPHPYLPSYLPLIQLSKKNMSVSSKYLHWYC